MPNHVKYRDIPKTERKRLIQEVSNSWPMRGLFFACLFISLMCSTSIRDYIVSLGVFPIGKFLLGLILSVAFTSLVVSVIYLPVVRHKVLERKKA